MCVISAVFPMKDGNGWNESETWGGMGGKKTMLSKELYMLNLDDIKSTGELKPVIMLIPVGFEKHTVEKDMNKAQEVIRHDE